MSCAAYTDPRLAAVYDPLNPRGVEARFYEAQIGAAPRTLLEIGCGTGAFAVRLAELGHHVTGTDPAAEMLNIARSRPGCEQVTWVESDAASLSIGRKFDVAVMTGHVYQVFLTDDAVAAALASIRSHLAPGGRLMFETRNPSACEWEIWTPDKTRERVSVPEVGEVGVHYNIKAVDGELVTFETVFQFAGNDIVRVDNTLRFMWAARVADLLDYAGFYDVTWYGDWDGSNMRPGCPEIIVIAN